jgi:Galactose oxidase, central domain/Kelch motif
MTRLHFLLVISALLSATAFETKLPDGSRRLGQILPAAPMMEPRSGHTATLLPNGKVLIAGGMRRNQDFYRSAELYDPVTRKFELTGDMHERRVSHIAVLLHSGKVLIAGGWVGHGCTSSAELYEPSSGKFTMLPAKLSQPRGDARATLLHNGDVLITGGGESDSPAGVASAEVFHTATMTFGVVSPMHFARVAHTSTLLPDGRVLIVGGRGVKVNATAEIYDPEAKRFTVTGNLVTARYKHTAGLLADGRVLVAGGSDERDWTGNLASAEIYDPKTGKFQAVAAMNESRFKLPEEAVRLESGDLLMGGGSKQVELFDSASFRFVAVSGQMSDSRHFMTETKLRDGSVLFAGGYPNNDLATAQTWLYKP